MTQKTKTPLWILIVLVVACVLVPGTGIVLSQYWEVKDHFQVEKMRFQAEFGQPADIENLGSLARKNRELVIWEKIRDMAGSIVTEEALAKSALRGLDVDRDPQKIALAKSARERAEHNKSKLVTLLGLAWRFGQFENADQTSSYGFLSRLVADDVMIGKKWSDIYKEIEEMKPQP